MESDTGSKRSFRLPLKKTGAPGAIFYCLFVWVPVLLLLAGRPQKGGSYADIAGG